MQTLFIDVREPDEFAAEHVAGAINMPLSKLMAGAKPSENISKDKELVVYCRSGSRSKVAISILRNMGYINLIDGINKNHVQANYGV